MPLAPALFALAVWGPTLAATSLNWVEPTELLQEDNVALLQVSLSVKPGSQATDSTYPAESVAVKPDGTLQDGRRDTAGHLSSDFSIPGVSKAAMVSASEASAPAPLPAEKPQPSHEVADVRSHLDQRHQWQAYEEGQDQDISAANQTPAGSAGCGFVVHSGLLPLVYRPSTESLAIDLTDALAASTSGKVSVMVTAMNVKGTYLDGQGYAAQYAYPDEQPESTFFEFRADGTSVNVFKPVMHVRTSDNQSTMAVENGIGDGWYETLPQLQTPLCSSGASSGTSLEQPFPSVTSGDRILIDASRLINRGFFVAGSFSSMALTYELTRVRAFQRNIDVTVKYLMADTNPNSPWEIGYSLIVLPETPMTPRPADDRLLYFTTDYTDMGYRHNGPGEVASRIVDRADKMIWRYNIARLPGHEIRIHVDPTVPERWRPYFASGIEAWNDGFDLAGRGHIRAVLPGSPLWPEDYDIADVRYSTIAWTLSSSVVSMGMAKVDPRSGEIMKSDIIMGEGWVRSYLRELDHVFPNMSHTGPLLLEETTIAEKIQTSGGDNKAASAAGAEAEAEHRARATGLASFSFISESLGRRLTPAQQEELLGLGLRDVVMHEVGHILGLRHNFKGSAGVSYECSMDKRCAQEQGLTASVMDYMGINLPTSAHPDVFAFTPVIGGYDKLAIRYGYMPATTVSWPHVAPELEAVLTEAETFGTCYDSDEYGEDPSCMAYDATGDPVRYMEDRVATFIQAQQTLLQSLVGPGDDFTYYGEAVSRMLMLTQHLGGDAIHWIGGINNTYAHRDARSQEWIAEEAPGGRRPMPASKQRQALRLLLRLLRPEREGLLPPADALPFLVTGSIDSVSSFNLPKQARDMEDYFLDHVLVASRVNQVHKQQELLSPGSADGYWHDGEEGAWSIGEFFDTIVAGVLGDGLGAPEPSEWHLHHTLIVKLKRLYLTGADDGLPDEVSSQVLYQLQRIHSSLNEARLGLPSSVPAASWTTCGSEGADCTCAGLVRFGHAGAWSAPHVSAGSMACSAAAFSDAQEVAPERRSCECLPGTPKGADLLQAHFTLLDRELSEVFCEESEPSCLAPRVYVSRSFARGRAAPTALAALATVAISIRSVR